jgi:hypothetical protein
MWARHRENFYRDFDSLTICLVFIEIVSMVITRQNVAPSYLRMDKTKSLWLKEGAFFVESEEGDCEESRAYRDRK